MLDVDHSGFNDQSYESDAMTSARLAELRRTLTAKRGAHHELRAPLTLAGLKRIAQREGIEIVARPHPRLGELVPLLGHWLIIIDRNQPKAAWVIIGAHELAHLWLHHDPLHERHETAVYDGSPPWYDAVREEEADVFAELLVRGPMCQSSTANAKPREKTALSKPTHNMPQIIPAAFDDGRAYERRLAKQGAQRVTAAPATWINQWWSAAR